jgi:RNA polymerase sigma-70 factor (ECF subfamily)
MSFGLAGEEPARRLNSTKEGTAPGNCAVDETRQSLLLRAQGGEQAAWKDLAELYRPLLHSWLRRQGAPASDLDDLTQEVLLSVVRSLPSFSHSGQAGAFRSWLRAIACNRASDYWKARRREPASTDPAAALAQVEDPDSELSRQWEREHDQYVLRCLLELVEQEFEPTTLRAFRRLALEGASGAEVAAELGLSVGAIYVAKSRVLRRIHELAEGLID